MRKRLLYWRLIHRKPHFEHLTANLSEIEAVLPQLVQNRDNGYKAVKYDKLVALLIEGIKEQQTQIHSLTIEIEKLKESKGL